MTPPRNVEGGGSSHLPNREGMQDGGRLETHTSSGNTKVLPENTPISVLHLVNRFIRPMPLVKTVLCSPPSLHGIRELRFDSCSPRSLVIVHAGDTSTAEHDLGHALALNDRGGGHVCSSIVLCVPIKDKLPVVHLADFPLLLVYSEVTDPDRTEVCVGHLWDISRDDFGSRRRGRG